VKALCVAVSQADVADPGRRAGPPSAIVRGVEPPIRAVAETVVVVPASLRRRGFAVDLADGIAADAWVVDRGERNAAHAKQVLAIDGPAAEGHA
jgi:hypothetical protein